jgi:hypothetical protein
MQSTERATGGTTVTVIETTARTPLQAVAHDLYRDIHKGIRSELFDLTGDAGRLDPADTPARIGLAARLAGVTELLEAHADHEDTAVGPVLELHRPDLAEAIEGDHHRLEARLVDLAAMAVEAADAQRTTQRAATHRLYVELASFTSDYLAHQDLEERVVMPALEAAIGPETVMEVHQAIVGSIPPEQMAQSLSVMLPAMNIDDRTEMLGGMQAGAPVEVFAGVWALAGSLLSEADHVALGRRLGIA